MKALQSPDTSPGPRALNEALPDLLPARMLNEFVYCPRLFFYEWVEGLFAENVETVEGAIRHAKVDKEPAKFPTAEAVAAVCDRQEGQAHTETIHGRSLTLSSQQHRLIAKIDLVEGESSAGVPPVVSPVDYKRGAPREADEGGPALWDADRIQLAVQALVLRENGYRCEEGIIYYVATRQRVRLPITDDLIAETTAVAEKARAVAASGQIPPPLMDSPKCPRCSLVGICLPDETRLSAEIEVVDDSVATQAEQLPLFPANHESRVTNHEPRRLIPARDDLRPLYLNTPGLRVGISGGVLQVKDRDKLLQEIRLGEICQLNLFGNIQLSTQAIQTLCAEEVPIAYFSMGGWFYGLTRGMGLKNIFLRREQFRHADLPPFCLSVARALVAGKIQNQRTMLQRNHIEPPTSALVALKRGVDEAQAAESMDALLGIEGNASRIYFENLAGMIKLNEEPGDKSRSQFTFDFINRNRRPPRDAVNALLSLAYSILAKDLAVTCLAVGFDPYLGFYHQPRFGRPALALDLMEPFRPLVADSAVLSAINNRMISPNDFVQAGPAVMLNPDGRKAFFRAYEQRMDTLVTHPVFGYRVNYRRILEIQTRLLARVLTREVPRYSAFVTR
jgi:CRISPR-associated protein Cas1